MSAELIENLMYDMVGDMTILNEFNFDWVIQGDKDVRKGNRTGGAISIDFEGEDNTNASGGIGSGKYIDDAKVFITGKVNLNTPSTRGYNVERLTKRQYTKALDDIKTRYDSPKYLSSRYPEFRELMYKGCEFLKIEKEGKFRSLRVKCEFMVKYTTQRKLLDV